MLLMVEKGVRGGIYHAMHQYVDANNEKVIGLMKDESVLMNLVNFLSFLYKAYC